MFQKIKKQILNFNYLYMDYLLINSLISLFIFKINKITFQISFIYLFIGIIISVIIFKKYLIIIGNKIKNTYIFNFILYYDLKIKEFIYICIFNFIETTFLNIYLKIYLFLFFFSFSYILMTFLFYIGIHFNLVFYLLLLFISTLNLIENQYIFTQQNINENKLENLNFEKIQNILFIKNIKFKKNQNLFYLQKRYVHFSELRSFLQKHGITILSSTAAGTLFTGYLQHTSVRVQEQQLEQNAKQHEELIQMQKEQLEHQKNSDIQNSNKWKEEFDLQKHKLKEKALNDREIRLENYDKKIESLNKKIHKLQVDMDTKHFWNKVDFSETIEELKNERSALKKRRSSIEEEKINENDENLRPNFKKHKSLEELSTLKIENSSIDEFFI